MRRNVAVNLALALGLHATNVVAQEAGSQRSAPAATLGIPAVSLGAPRAAQADQRIIRAKAEDKAPLPTGPSLMNSPPPLPPGAIPMSGLPAPTPLGGNVAPPPVPVYGTPIPLPPNGSTVIPPPPLVEGPVDGIAMDGGFFGGDMAPLPGGMFFGNGAARRQRFWIGIEYLYWTVSDSTLPVLLSEGTRPAFLNNAPPTPLQENVLYGNSSVSPQGHNGARLAGGMWFSDSQCWGMDFSIWGLNSTGNDYTFARSASTQAADSYRPYNNVINRNGTPGGLDYELVSTTRGLGGTFQANSSTELWGGDINFRRNLICNCRGRLDFLFGFRYLNLQDNIDINEALVSVGNDRFFISDHFDTTNNFYGGQVGLAQQWRRGRWSLDLIGKVGLGNTHSTVNVSGSQIFTPGAASVQAGIPAGTAPYGLLTQPSNIGTRSVDNFSVVPEVGLTVGYNITPRFKLFAGYNFLYWSNVLRAADQIDTTLNINTNVAAPLPPLNQPRPGIGDPRPVVPMRDTGLWAQGATVGLQFSW